MAAISASDALLAEAVTFSPGEVVLVLALLGVVIAVAGGVVVVGIVAGYRSGRDPQRGPARRAWVACLAVEALWLIPAASSREPAAVLFVLGAAGAAIAAREIGRRSPMPDDMPVQE